MKIKKLSATFLSAVAAVVLSVNIMPQFTMTGSSAGSSGVNVKSHSQADINSYVKSHPFDTSTAVSYSKKPDMDSPYTNAGALNDESLQNALNALNVVRYIAGLDEVTLNKSYNELCQAGAYVNSINGELSHFPSQPAGLSDDIFALGEEACSSSNIGMGYTNIAESIIDGYMYDSDDSNIDRIGHRRWCLNPYMEQTGFGYVGRYTAMYSFDCNGSSEATGVAWPAQNMPIQYFGSRYAWNYSFGSYVDSSAVKVTLERNSDGKKWTFSDSHSDGYFNVENSGYGQSGCIIFRPDDIKYAAGESFEVSITGLDTAVNYTVNFFALEHKHIYPDWTTTKEADCGSEGSRVSSCEICGITKTETIPKTNSHTYGDWVEKQKADCQTEGVKTQTCKVCKKTKTESIPKTDHQYGEWITLKEASCKNDGSKERTCSVCSKKETVTLPRTSTHKFGKKTTLKEPTCKEEGSAEQVCTVCGKKETVTLAKTNDHKYGEYSKTKEADCKNEGTMTAVCSVCGGSHTKSIPALEHNFSDWKLKTPATADKEGVEERSCDVCGKIETRKIAKLSDSETTTSSDSGSSEKDSSAASEITSDSDETDPGTPDVSGTSSSSAEKSEVSEKNSEKSDSNMVMIFAIAGGVIVVAAVIVIVAVRRRKRK